MIVRDLPASEWDRLTGTELERIRVLFRPDQARVLVVENDAGEIVGCWSLFAAWHVEGLWIAPAYRGQGNVARRLLRTMKSWIRTAGVSGVVTASLDPAVSAYLIRLGAYPLPGAAYIWPMQP